MVSVGPSTSRVIRSYGMTVGFESRARTMSAIVVQGESTQLGLRIDAVNDVVELQDTRPAEAEILRPGLEKCMNPVAATSIQGASVSGRKTIWHLSVERLFDRLIEVFSTPRKKV